MKFRIVFLWVLLLTGMVNAQDPIAKKYASEVSAATLKEYLSIIASDALEGRKVGTRGQKMAAAFIAAHFEEIGLSAPVNGSYFQPVNLYSSSIDEAYLKAGQNKFENYSGIIYYGSDDTGGEISIPVVFVGNGSEVDFNQVDVKDKAALFFSTEATLLGSKSVALAREKGAKIVLVNNSNNLEEFEVLADQYKAFAAAVKPTLNKPRPNRSSGTFIISSSTVEKIMGTTMEKLRKAASDNPKKNSLKKIKPIELQYKISAGVKVIKSENVLGYLEGTDKKNELVVITAHYDHIGKNSGGEGDLINNGADDDGSGTVAIMNMAKAFAQAKKDGNGPRRSMLFMTVTAEERGLLGSEHYSDHPVFPLESTVVDLNIDMIGRKDAEHKDSAPYLYIIGSDKLSADLHALSENVNKKYTNLIFDYTYNDLNHPTQLYTRSDHWNFAKKNIPVIFYFDGIMEDYHKPTDEVEKIEFGLMEKRARLVFYTAWEIANRDQRLVVDPEKKIKQ